MWKFRFWLAVAHIYNDLAKVTSCVTKFFIERCKHGIKKHDEYYSKYIESQKDGHEYLK